MGPTLTLVRPRVKTYADACDWCDRLFWHSGVMTVIVPMGRFCSDECAALYAEAFAAGEMPEPRKAI